MDVKLHLIQFLIMKKTSNSDDRKQEGVDDSIIQ